MGQGSGISIWSGDHHAATTGLGWHLAERTSRFITTYILLYYKIPCNIAMKVRRARHSKRRTCEGTKADEPRRGKNLPQGDKTTQAKTLLQT